MILLTKYDKNYFKNQKLKQFQQNLFNQFNNGKKRYFTVFLNHYKKINTKFEVKLLTKLIIKLTLFL